MTVQKKSDNLITLALDISALDPAFKEHAARGIGRYVRELHTGLKDFFPSADLDLKTFNHTSLAPSPRLDKILKSFPLGKQTIRQQLYYPYRLKKMKGIDLLHFPAHMDPPAYCPVPYIVSVMDLIPLLLPNLYKAERSDLRFKLARFLEMQAIKRADLVLAISKTTALDVQNLLDVPEERIVVTPLGVDEKFFGAKLTSNKEDLCLRYNIPANRKIILYVGGIDQRKNCRTMLEAVRKVRTATLEKNQTPPVFVMVGKIQGDRQFPKLCELIAKFDLQNDVYPVGYVPDQDLLQLFAISSVFLFLSLYEGFGLPPLEALAAGLPVVSSKTSAMPEVLGDAALLVDPEDGMEAASAILKILQSKEVANTLKEKGKEQAKKFTWKETCALTACAYQQMAEKIRQSSKLLNS